MADFRSKAYAVHATPPGTTVDRVNRFSMLWLAQRSAVLRKKAGFLRVWIGEAPYAEER